MPGVVHGLLQTEGYARALLETAPAVTGEIVTARLAARMERQQHVLMREDPPLAWLLVDQLALYRLVGRPAPKPGLRRSARGRGRAGRASG